MFTLTHNPSKLEQLRCQLCEFQQQQSVLGCLLGGSNPRVDIITERLWRIWNLNESQIKIKWISSSAENLIQREMERRQKTKWGQGCQTHFFVIFLQLFFSAAPHGLYFLQFFFFFFLILSCVLSASFPSFPTAFVHDDSAVTVEGRVSIACRLPLATDHPSLWVFGAVQQALPPVLATTLTLAWPQCSGHRRPFFYYYYFHLFLSFFFSAPSWTVIREQAARFCLT